MKHALNTNTIYVLSFAFIIWGVFGLMDIKNNTFDGFDTNQFEVIRIEKEGPAYQAGMKIGDILVSSDGISIKDYKELDKRPRAKIGQTRTYVIEIAGEEQTLELTYAELPQKNKTNRYIQFVIGLLFILLPSVVTSKSNSDLKLSLGLSMTTFGFLFLDGPYFDNGPLKRIFRCYWYSHHYFCIDIFSRLPSQICTTKQCNSDKNLFELIVSCFPQWPLL